MAGSARGRRRSTPAGAQLEPRTTSPDGAADLAHARAAAVLAGKDIRVHNITTGEELELVPAVEEMEELLRAEDSNQYYLAPENSGSQVRTVRPLLSGVRMLHYGPAVAKVKNCFL